MSCPDWRRPELAGDEFLRPGSSERRAVLEHAADCPDCRRRALHLDPSLAAADLPVTEPSRSEVEAIKGGVRVLRRVRAVERSSRRRRARGRLAAVAGLTLAILLFAEETGDRSPGEGSPSPAGAPSLLLSEEYRLYGALPLVESLEPSEARVYQLGREDFSLVWIVDESIEVSPEP